MNNCETDTTCPPLDSENTVLNSTALDSPAQESSEQDNNERQTIPQPSTTAPKVPELEILSIQPALLDGTTPAVCTRPTSAASDDSSAPVRIYEWKVNDSNWSYPTNTLDAKNFQKGDKLQCRTLVTTIDEGVNKTTVQGSSATVTVGNQAPAAFTSATLGPLQSNATTATCTATGSLVDPDSQDSLTAQFSLQKAGLGGWVTLKSQAESLFNGLQLKIGESYRCQATLSDGTDTTSPTNSNVQLVAGVWQSEALLSVDTHLPYNPMTALDPSGSGQAAVIWIQFSNRELYARLFDGSSWSAAQYLDKLDYNTNKYSVQFDPNGRVFVVWENSSSLHSTSFNGSTWGPTVTGPSGSEHNFDFISSTSATVAYRSPSGEVNLIPLTISDSGVIWGTSSKPPGPQSVTGWLPQIVSFGDGTGHLLWKVPSGLASSRYDGQQWLPSQSIPASQSIAMDLQLALDPNKTGAAAAVWTRENASNANSEIWSSKFNGVTWETAQQLSPSMSDEDCCDAYLPQITFDIESKAFALWTDEFTSKVSMRSHNGTTWADRIDFGSPTYNSLMSRVKVATNASGKSIAVWYTGTAIYAQPFHSGRLEGQVNISNTSGRSDDSNGQPNVSMDALGRVLTVWKNDYKIYAKFFQ